MSRDTFRERIFHWLQRTTGIDDERRQEVRRALREAVHPDFDYFAMVVLSSVMATLGLLMDSAATVIGAMLVAPLMSSVLALGFAALIGDRELFQHGAQTLAQGAVIAIMVALGLSALNLWLPLAPLQELPRQVLLRTRPGPMDWGVALAGGAAAALAMALPQISPTLPGVAIATALLPPLCTVGVGLAVRQWSIAGGAFLLFLTNAVTIAFASMAVFYLLGFGPTLPDGSPQWNEVPRSLRMSAFLALVLLLPLIYMSVQYVRQATLVREIRNITQEEAQRLDAEVTELLILSEDPVRLNLTVRVERPLAYQQVVDMQRRIATRLQRPVSIVVFQVLAARLDPLVPPTPTPTPTPGPSPTPTATPTFTPTPTATPTPTPTWTPTPTATFTPTPTPFPVQARVVNTGGRGLKMRQWPEGPVIARLQPGEVLWVWMHDTQVVGPYVWVRAQDEEGRVGWVVLAYLATLTPTPMP